MRRKRPSISTQIPLFPPAGAERRIELAAPQQQELIRAVAKDEAVDPDNRLVAAELEARWNGALEQVVELEARLKAQERVAPSAVPVDRETLESLATDLQTVWDAPSSEMRVKQRIARLLIHAIIATARTSASSATSSSAFGGPPRRWSR